MARAASYYYQPSSSLCVFCHRSSLQEISFRHAVSDLFEDQVMIPCHLRCYRLRLVGFWLGFILVAVITVVAIRVLELAIFYHTYLPWGRLPVWLTILNALLGLFLGAYLALRAYFRFLDKINDYIQLNTFPID